MYKNVATCRFLLCCKQGTVQVRGYTLCSFFFFFNFKKDEYKTQTRNLLPCLGSLDHSPPIFAKFIYKYHAKPSLSDTTT